MNYDGLKYTFLRNFVLFSFKVIGFFKEGNFKILQVTPYLEEALLNLLRALHSFIFV